MVAFSELTDDTSRLPAPPALTANAALFLDLDGTLLDFAPRPDGVIVADGLRDSLRCLQCALGGALAIVSGRSLAQIDDLGAFSDIAAAGLHGAQIRRTDGRVVSALGSATALDAVRRVANDRAAAIPGVFVEDKRDAIALHFRTVPEAAGAVDAISVELLHIAGSGFALQHGNHVIELRPQGSDKGTALDALMRDPDFSGRRPWMIGDDRTDEFGFGAANRQGGVSIIVGPRRPTSARHALGDPAAVRQWLARSAETLGQKEH